MGTAVIAVMAFAIVLAVSFTSLGNIVSLGTTSADSMRASWSEAERTIDSSIVPLLARSDEETVEVFIVNRGRLKYASPQFSDWEVLVRYEDDGGTPRVDYLEFATTLSEGNWVIEQIYLDRSTSTVEVYEPGILNPGEEMHIRGQLSAEVGSSTSNQVTISPPEGWAGTVNFDE